MIMADYTTLKDAIKDAIKQNDNNEITGPVLQEVLLAMVNSLGVGFQFVGLATPETEPGTPDQNIFYIAGPGTYPNFDGLEIPVGQIGVLSYNGEWDSELLEIPSDFINVNSLAVHPSAYSNRAAAIADVPSSARKAGLVIAYYVAGESAVGQWVIEQFVGASWGSEDTKWRSIGEPEKELADTEENGFFVTDAILNILIQYTSAGFDVSKLSDHFKQLINEIVSNGAIADVEEKGFFVVDQMLNVGFKVDKNGAHAKNILEYEIINN